VNNDVYRVAGLRVEAGKHYVTVIHVSHIKGYHLPTNEEPNKESKIMGHDEEDTEHVEEDRPQNVSNIEKIESRQSEVQDKQSKRQRKHQLGIHLTRCN